ncbi:putative lipopolysaccharide biosynthesis protein [Campylobacter hyointestinalis]|uniref:glycosyltransferase n=1 Tax=Campylobacter hyointestinalis TaxID=198 RepID=UPI000724CFA0|nr:glycosyltransferase [Campylobacter hyointestinalis]PPB55583.1 lipopolysaccharide biosynthesis protein [Campylobacter hyointestinalis subsp. hyointestinalis]CUU81799.1 putative lipopolysaccharide biosynthesis protein [Campylobacter hyointestinalis]
MRILHTLHWVQFAGTEKVCVDLCNEFCKSHEVFLMTNDKIKTYTSDKVNLIAVDFEKNRYNPIFLYEIAKIIKDINPDVIHCHNTKELEIMYNARIFMKKKIPIVATKHTLKAKKRYDKADLCVAILEDTKEILKPNSIIIKNGMAYKEPKKMQRDDKFYIISASRLSPVKGNQIIIEALSMVNFDFKFDIFGQGEQKDELQNLINSLNLQDKITLQGFTDNLQDYLASCDVQIIASVFEPYGLTAIDGIYYSPLLLSTRTGICAQILPDELIFENSPENLAIKLTQVYENYDKYRELFAKIKETKDNFSIEKMAEKYIQAYESVIK